MKIEVKDGKVALQINGEFNSEELRQLLHQIGDARSTIADDPQTLAAGNVEVKAVAFPPYWTEHSENTKNQTLFAFRHPAFGWLGFLLSPVEVARLIGYFGNQLVRGATIAEAGAATDVQPDQIRGGGLLH